MGFELIGYAGSVISSMDSLLENCICDLSHMKFGIGLVGSSVTKLEWCGMMLESEFGLVAGLNY